MTIHNIELPNIETWDAFVQANREEILSRYGSVDVAYRHACDGGLEIGGGAAPLFIVTFES